MPDSEKSGDEREKNGETPETDLAASIGMAFNLGVSFNQQTKGATSIAQALAEMGEHIFNSLNKAHGGKFQQEYIIANTEYLLQIALLGYIVPSICDYEENFKERLLALIEARARKQGPPGGESGNRSDEGGGKIITP